MDAKGFTAIAEVRALNLPATSEDLSLAQVIRPGQFFFMEVALTYDLTEHFALRAEYRGFVYERPDFGLQSLHSGAATHTAQPSAGIVFRF